MTTTLGPALSQIPTDTLYQQKLQSFMAIVEGTYAYPTRTMQASLPLAGDVR
jgi:hypothetical protein